MNIKALLILVLPALLCKSALAQDKIFRSDGKIVEVKIIKVGPGTITYKRSDNPNGPEYTISKSEADKIKYKNGSEEVFEHEGFVREKEHFSHQYRHKAERLAPNIVGFAPIQLTENGAVGFSLSYERALDYNNIISFYVPAILEFRSNNSTADNIHHSDPMFYVMPGVKFYPTGGYGLAKYAIGPSLVIADGQWTHDEITYYSTKTITENHFLFGMMINQSINLNPTPHLYVGSEFGFGFTYFNRLGGVNQGTDGLVQFNFKIGYRF